MRIAQVAPLWELVPPKTYGGTELVVHLLTEELVRQGHEVTLFAAAGSETAARLIPGSPQALRQMEEEFKCEKTHSSVMAYELGMVGDIMNRARAGEFDIIHNHMGFQMLPFASFLDIPMVTTLHNALNLDAVRELHERYSDSSLISISDYQQTLWPNLNYASTVYHGINLKKFNPSLDAEGKEYLAFLGRLSPEKGPHHAIRIAKELGMKLIMAGKIDHVDRIFYDREIAQHVDGEQIQYIGEVDHVGKEELLRNAAATLCPIEWAEPFGLVFIESMACGTPVFALRDGSVPEVIDHKRSGYVGDTVEELIEAVRNYRSFDRAEVRRVVENRFSMERMADDHVKLYSRLIEEMSRETSPHKRSKEDARSVTRKPKLESANGLTSSRVAGLRIPASGGQPFESTKLADVCIPNRQVVSKSLPK
jgi:glycosyltransferase involved in cell wall biosynthesis